MSLALGIEKLYPDAIPGVDWRVEDHGNGPRVVVWNEEKLGALPDDATLQADGEAYAQELQARRDAGKTERTARDQAFEFIRTHSVSEIATRLQNKQNEAFTVLAFLAKELSRRDERR